MQTADRSPRVAVIGAGKMGLPLACQLAQNGALVTACDRNPQAVDAINSGACPFEEPELPALLAKVVAEKKLTASTDTQAVVAKSDVVIVIVPVLLTADNSADTSVIESVAKDIGPAIRKGTMVSFETTLPVGFTRRLAEMLQTGGLKAGEDFDLAFSPERVKSGLVMDRLTQNPKVVGGITAQSAKRAEEFYGQYIGAPVINIGSLEAAEMVKLAGMVYRDVNIALANELARYAEEVGVDILPVIEAANTDGEASILTPGIGVGGHCTPVYPHFLLKDAAKRNVAVNLVEAARNTNDGQPRFVVRSLARTFTDLSAVRVLILGLGFRPQVKEAQCSPAFPLRDELERLGAAVFVHDPLYSPDEVDAFGFQWGHVNEPFDVMILNTGHDVYRQLDFEELGRAGLRTVVDGRNFFNPDDVERRGVSYIGIGRGANGSYLGRDTPTNGAAQGPQAGRVPLSRPNLGKEEERAAQAVIRRGWLMQGRGVETFEHEFAEYVGATHACAVSSGTTALHLALLAVGVKPLDEVVTVSHSFIATANSIRYCGAIPVFVDIEPGTYNMNPELVEAAIGPRTRAILCVHQMGMPCDLRALTRIARKHSLPLIEDAACAIGSEILINGWEKIGRPHGDVACFSFHPRKMLTTGDGGMLTTSNAAFDQQFRLWRNHGLNPKSAAYETLGFNYRMTDIQAAIGAEQLKRLPSMLTAREDLVRRYSTALRDLEGVGLPSRPEWARSNWQSLCVRLPADASQRKVIEHLAERGISCKTGIQCAHREPAYEQEAWSCKADLGGCDCGYGSCTSLQESAAAQDHSIILPLFDRMTDSELNAVVGALKEALAL
jgi:perosamine synthetase